MRSPTHRISRRIVMLGLLVGATAAVAAPGAVTESEARQVRAVIQAQLDAFGADDAERAFAQASPALRQQFGQAERFVAMVKQHYPVVYRPAAVRFLKAVRVDGELTQVGHITVAGQVPLSELNGYQARLNGLTGGQGRYTLALSHYEAVPPAVQVQLMGQHKARDEE